jgi:hypothetical protein
MTEGWRGDDYFILFSASEIPEQSKRYGIGEFLPGYSVLGLIGWDDFIVRDTGGSTFKLPTVPCVPQYLEPLQLPDLAQLEGDDRFRGKIKWYVTPIVFGGNPAPGNNLTWIEPEKHAAAVRWWNVKYRELRATEAYRFYF